MECARQYHKNDVEIMCKIHVNGGDIDNVHSVNNVKRNYICGHLILRHHVAIEDTIELEK